MAEQVSGLAGIAREFRLFDRMEVYCESVCGPDKTGRQLSELEGRANPGKVSGEVFSGSPMNLKHSFRPYVLACLVMLILGLPTFINGAALFYDLVYPM